MYKDTKNIFKNFNYQDFKSLPFPAEYSGEFNKEMSFLNSLPDNEEFVKKRDDIEGSFKEIFERNKIKFPSKLISKLMKDSTIVIKDLKNFYDRKRPWKYIKSKEGIHKLDSMDTPSYPSGHSTQAELISNFLTHYYPDLKDEFRKMSDEISFSRNVARAHYPSDSNFGKKLGKKMSDFLTQN